MGGRVGRWFVLLLAAISLAGCLSDSTETSAERARRLGDSRASEVLGISEDWAELALPFGSEHDHRDHSSHLNRSTPNFQVLGWDPLVTDYHGKSAGGYYCGDVAEKADRRIAVVHSFISDVAFVLIDVTDPNNPRKLGELAMSNTQVYDIALTPDQKFVLLATSPFGAGPEQVAGPPYGRATFHDACTGEVRPVAGPEAGLPFASGIILVDIANPLNPVIQDFRFFPVWGGHSVVAEEIGGRTLILVSVVNLVPLFPVGVFVSGQTNYYAFLDILSTPAGPRLQLLSIFQRLPDSPQGHVQELTRLSHDGSMQQHPVTGQNLAYLAYGHNGLVIVNIDDPRNPRFVSQWADWSVVGGPHPSHFIHETYPIEGTWDGKHYTFMGEECITGRPPKTPSCIVYAFDTTDPAQPGLLGVWTLPVDVGGWGYPLFTLHYIGVQGRTLFVTAAHGGLWAVDVSDDEALRTMPSIGVFLPDRLPPEGVATVNSPTNPFLFDESPLVADVLPTSDGNLILFDGSSGVYVVRFDAAHPAPPPIPWPIGKAASS